MLQTEPKATIALNRDGLWRQTELERRFESLDQQEHALHQSQMRLFREQMAAFVRDLNLMRQDQYPVDISKTAVTLLNNLEGLVPLVVVAWIKSEFDEIGPVFADLDAFGIIMVIASCIVGVGISYCGIWAQSLISATSFLVLVNANKFVIIFVEAFCMHAKVLKPIQIVGACVAIIGGVTYGKAREYLEADVKSQDAGETQPLVAEKKV
eukprot:UN4267